MNEDTIKLDLFRTLLNYSPDIRTAIEETEYAMDRLFRPNTVVDEIPF